MDTNERMQKLWERLIGELRLAQERRELPAVAKRADCFTVKRRLYNISFLQFFEERLKMDTNERLQKLWERLIGELRLAKDRKELPSVAAKAGCSIQSLYKYVNYERGKNVPYSSVYQLARGLGYSDDEIRSELYGDAKYLFMVDNHKLILDKIYDALINKEIDESKLSAMIDIMTKDK